MVRKSSGKWRICTDYIDMNKACLKDSYPLPINQLVVGALRIFKDHISRELEVYVDDMNCEALAQVFMVLQKHKLKLNLEKCLFSVEAGKFLGFMLTRRRIDANPEKYEAVINMRIPRSIKEPRRHWQSSSDYERTSGSSGQTNVRWPSKI
ncbi:Retrovirus-related Pol polyprotein from transposon opus, partial [Mucuna pruriens]